MTVILDVVFFARRCIWLEISLLLLLLFFAVQFFLFYFFYLVSLFVVVFLVLDVVSLSVAYLDATAAVFPD